MLLLIAWGAAGGPAATADAGEVSADAPLAVAVTVYRSPHRGSGSNDLNRLDGFALVSETRRVHLPAGESRLRFEGVADGIEPASAIVTGLGKGVLEKNRDAALLSPSTLMAAALGRPVELVRTLGTGKVERRDATILADAGGGVVFKTAAGLEALRCSGLPETFSFENVAGLASRPTLSVRVRTAAPMTGEVTLSYLARGFDWGADYIATLAADDKHMDLGAWVTLANGNGVGFPDARTQVVAGRVNRESGSVEPIELGGPILASCWPRGSTSDVPEMVQLKRFSPMGGQVARLEATLSARLPAAAAQDAMVSAQRVIQEQLGDLKLYRVPEPTTVAGRQSKQVRLLDRSAIPVDTVYGAELTSAERSGPRPASRWLRAKNDDTHHLGVPLPSGTVAVFAPHGSERLLVSEAGVRDLALDEELEIDTGTAANVQINLTQDLESHRVDITNARPQAVQFELKLRLDDGVRVENADRPMTTKNGRPLFRLTIPARSAVTLHYQTTKSGAAH